MQFWKKLNEINAYNGWRKIIQKEFELPDGKQASFDVVGNNPYVTVAAFTEQEEAILVRQYRPGPEKVLVSFAEGYLDPNETAISAGRRELKEETGFEPQEIIFLKEKRSAYSTERQIFLLATGCKKFGTQELDQTEFIDVITMPIPAFILYLRDQTIDEFTNLDGAFMALDYLRKL